jgi:hypothetical protein
MLESRHLQGKRQTDNVALSTGRRNGDMLKRLLPTALLAIAMAGPAAAAPFDPAAPCAEMLSAESGIPPAGMSFWAFGFIDGATAKPHQVTPEGIDTMTADLRQRCAAAPEASLYDIAAEIGTSDKSGEPAVAGDGRALLQRFFDAAEDHGALTLSLKPSPEDVRAVYAEPLASALIDAYDGMFVPGAVIEPKPEHKQLLTTFTTTGRLKAGDPVLDDFPGGYRDVLRYIVADVPIGRFKFVKPGATLGLAFDGLIFVNDRWVFMPKPWRGLPDAQ